MIYDKIYNKPPFAHDSMEYGKRCANEREIQQETGIFSAAQTAGSSSNKRVPQRLSIQFIDTGGSYLLVPSMMGLKVLDWRRKRLLGVTGQADAGSLRLISVCVKAGDAVIKQQLQLARGALAMNTTDKADHEEEEQKTAVTDTLILALAYNHVDPVLSNLAFSAEALVRRDVWKEAPSVADRLYAPSSAQTTATDATKEEPVTSAILRTTLGDIHIQLFGAQVPKTLSATADRDTTTMSFFIA
jgi:peptidylprolyl isomerase domain and WD repeat-containing protein 1